MKNKNRIFLLVLSFILLIISNSRNVYADEQNKSCHIGCKECKGSSENSCTQCYSGRGEKVTNQAIYNSCPCFSNYEEQFDPTCDPISSQYESTKMISDILVILLVIILIFLAASGHHLLTFMIYDAYQLIGYLRLINIPLTGIMDNILETLQKLNVNILFGNTLDFNEKMTLLNGKSSTTEILNVSDQNIESPIKLPLLGYSYSFLYNTMTLLIIYIVIGSVLSFFVILQKYNRYKSGLIFLINQKRYTIIVRLIIITICEVIFYAFLQLKQISFSNSFNQFSFFLTLISLICLAILVFFIIFAINWTIQVNEMVNPKYNTYFDKLKNKNTFNRNLICIQVFVKLLFISFVSVGIESPSTCLLMLLLLYLAYVLLLIFCLSLNKPRLHIAYIALCFSVIIQIIMIWIYYSFTDDLYQNKVKLIVISWIFVIFLFISLILSTSYAVFELICVIPILFNYVRQTCNYLTSKQDKEIDENGNIKNTENEENSKDISTNLDLPLVARRKIASKAKKQSTNQINFGNNNQSQWFDNPLSSKKEKEIDVIQQNFSQISFELNDKQRVSKIDHHEFELQNKDL